MNNEQRAMNGSSTKDIVLAKAEAYAHAVYQLARKLPRDELFGLTSQLRRAALSVPLNIVEGFARQSSKTQLQFLKISYGSLKEAQFILDFAVKENYFTTDDIRHTADLGEEVGKLIWAKTRTLGERNS
jgi:four helix bundle protein